MKRVNISLIITTITFFVVLMVLSCEKIEEINGVYTVTFNSKGGSKVESQKVVEDELIIEPTAPTRDGYGFGGWAKDDNESSALWNFYSERVTSSMTLYARWSINTHKITFDSDGGSVVPTQSVQYGKTASRPNDPVRNGYEFDGWFNGDTEWNFSTVISTSITLIARWTQVHVVTFDADNGSEITTQTIRNGATIGKPEDQTKAFSPAALLFAGQVNPNMLPSHDTFVEWRKEGESTAFNFNAPITDAITLKATWNSPSVQGSIDISTQSGINRVEQAFTYIKTNPAEYTLFIGADVMIDHKTLDMSYLKLTVIGLVTKRTIKVREGYQTEPIIFSVGGPQRVGISLTLGNNIRLNRTVEVIGGADFIMLDGSEISGYTGGYIGGSIGTNAPVNVSNASTFTMKGGEIKNNSIQYQIGFQTSGVFVSDGGVFKMEGGKIRNNSGDVFVNQSSTFTLSGNAEAGFVYLNASNTANATISISTGWNGMVDKLNLTGNTGMTNLINWWIGKQLLSGEGVNSSVISKFSLGNFHDTSYGGTSQSLVNYEINSNGVLASKQ